MNALQYKRLILVGSAVLLAVLFALYLSFIYISRAGKNAVLIDIFPENAEITLDDRKIDRGTVYLEPGTYSIRASLGGFNDFSDTLVVGDHVKTYVITLTPASEEAEKFYEENEKSYARVRKLSEQAKIESGEYFHKQNPIASKLPERTLIYTIGYRMDPSDPSGNSIIIEIDASEGYKQAALNRIRQLGYDPTDLTINFRGYENPFPL